MKLLFCALLLLLSSGCKVQDETQVSFDGIILTSSSTGDSGMKLDNEVCGLEARAQDFERLILEAKKSKFKYHYSLIKVKMTGKKRINNLNECFFHADKIFKIAILNSESAIHDSYREIFQIDPRVENSGTKPNQHNSHDSPNSNKF